MNKRDLAVMRWVQKHRPDLTGHIQQILLAGTDGPSQGVYAVMAMAFEAGRGFQADNRELELDNPNVY
jgi:hypothetical protein